MGVHVGNAVLVDLWSTHVATTTDNYTVQLEPLCGSQARAGDGVDVTVAGVEPQLLSVGSVLCSPGWPVPQVTCFEARVVVLQPPIPILHGQQVGTHFCDLCNNTCVIGWLSQQFVCTHGQPTLPMLHLQAP